MTIFDGAIFDGVIFDTGETVSVGSITCSLDAQEASDIAEFRLGIISYGRVFETGGGDLDEEKKKQIAVELYAVEDNDSVHFNSVTIPIKCKMYSTETIDSARFEMEEDFTDQEIVMMLIAAAYEKDEIEV